MNILVSYPKLDLMLNFWSKNNWSTIKISVSPPSLLFPSPPSARSPPGSPPGEWGDGGSRLGFQGRCYAVLDFLGLVSLHRGPCRRPGAGPRRGWSLFSPSITSSSASFLPLWPLVTASSLPLLLHSRSRHKDTIDQSFVLSISNQRQLGPFTITLSLTFPSLFPH